MKENKDSLYYGIILILLLYGFTFYSVMNIISYAEMINFTCPDNAYCLKTSSTDLTYSFAENQYIENNSLLPFNTFNLQNQKNITTHYNATNSFENETLGSVPSFWTDISTNDAITQVNNTDATHSYALELVSTPTGLARIYRYFSPQSYLFFVELWYKPIDATRQGYILFFEDAVQKLTFRCANDLFYWHDGAWQTLDTIPLDNTWFHLRFEISSYTDTTNIYINGYDEGNYSNSNVATYINRLDFSADQGFDYNYYIDAIGFSMYNYDMGDNVVPYQYYNSVQEIQYYPFCYDECLKL